MKLTSDCLIFVDVCMCVCVCVFEIQGESRDADGGGVCGGHGQKCGGGGGGAELQARRLDCKTHSRYAIQHTLHSTAQTLTSHAERHWERRVKLCTEVVMAYITRLTQL